MDKNVNKNLIYSILKNLSSVLFPVITFSYISRILGPENVGKVNFSLSIISYVSLVAALGITTYGVRESAKLRENKEQLNIFTSQLYSINIISTVVAYIILFFSIAFFPQLRNYRALILILSTTVFFTTIGADWINTAFEDFKYITIRTLLCQALTFVLLILFVRNENDYVVYAVVLVVAQSGANIVNYFYRRKYCIMRITTAIDLKKHIPPIMLLFSMTIFQTIFVNTDLTILGIYHGDYEVGLYSAAAKITRMVDLAIAAVVWVVLPQLSQKYANKDYEGMRRLHKYSLSIILDLGLPAVIGMIAISRELLICFAGNEYQGADISLVILSIGTFASLLGGFVGNIILLPMGKEKVLLRSSVICALVNLILNLILIPRFGQIAAAGTTLIAYIIGFIYCYFHVDKVFKIKDISKLIKAPFIEIIIIVFSSIAYKTLFTNSYLITFMTIATSIISYLIILYVFKDEFFMGYYTPILNRIKGKRNQ